MDDSVMDFAVSSDFGKIKDMLVAYHICLQHDTMHLSREAKDDRFALTVI